MLLSEAGADFIHYCSGERGHTPATVQCYRQGIRRFATWLESQGHPNPSIDSISVTLARRYMYYLDGLGLRPRTRRTLFIPLRALFVMLVEHGATEKNPFVEVRLPKKDAAQRLLVTDGELEALFEAAGRNANPTLAARNQAVFAAMIFCGLRRAELLDLRVGDIELSEGTLLVRMGKGLKSRRIWLCSEAKDAFARWLKSRPVCTHDYLFIIDYSRRLAEIGLKSVIDTVKATAGFAGAPHIACHSMRHAAATRLMRNGADISSIQKFLGHAQLQTTAIYLHTDEQQLQKIAGLASFRTEPVKPVSAATDESELGSDRGVRRLRRQSRSRSGR